MENNTNYNRLPSKVPLPKIINDLDNTNNWEGEIVPIANGRVDGDTIRIICPYCAKTHKHGYREGIYPAHRVSHCHLKKATDGYLVVINGKADLDKTDRKEENYYDQC